VRWTVNWGSWNWRCCRSVACRSSWPDQSVLVNTTVRPTNARGNSSTSVDVHGRPVFVQIVVEPSMTDCWPHNSSPSDSCTDQSPVNLGYFCRRRWRLNSCFDYVYLLIIRLGLASLDCCNSLRCGPLGNWLIEWYDCCLFVCPSVFCALYIA